MDPEDILIRAVEPEDAAALAEVFNQPRAIWGTLQVPFVSVEARRKRIILTGDIPSPVNPPSGCRFHTRCPIAFDRCKVEVPAFTEYEPGHRAACHWVEEHGGAAPDLTVTPTASV